jgi:hypothetical protein
MTALLHFRHRLLSAPAVAGIAGKLIQESGMRAIFSLAAVGLLAGPANAAKAPPPLSPYVSALDQCRQIADSAQRLACYDRTVPPLVTASRSGQINIVDRGELRQARRSLFGFSMPKLPFFVGDQSAADTPDQIDTTIKSAWDLGYGKYRIKVTEGDAVWETTEESFLEPKAGQKIIIRRGPLGSYFLRINGNAGVKGRRVG